MAKLVNGDKIYNIITDGDIIITSPYKNGKTLNEVLVEQQSDIDKLKSNVKYIYAYGGIGRKGGSGSGNVDLREYATKDFVTGEIKKIVIPDVNDYYTKSETDNLLLDKQDILSGSDYIQINDNIVSINSENLLNDYPVLDSENVLVAGAENACFVSNPRRYEPNTGEWLDNNYALGNFSSAFGFNCKINSSGANSFIAGDSSTINSEDSFVFGQNCHVESNSSHSFVGGKDCYSRYRNCFIYGEGLEPGQPNQTVLGKFNNPINWNEQNVPFVVGWGSNQQQKRTILAVQDGPCTNNGDGGLMSWGPMKAGASWLNDFGEYFEWVDGNLDNEDRIGYMVQLNGEKIEYAKSFEKCIGIISGTCSFVGSSCSLEWHGRFLKDEWGRHLYDEENNLIINPEYDENLEYIPREQRKEWSTVGLLGQVLTRQDGTLEVGGCAGCKDGIATKSDIGYKVLKIVNENIALLLVK